MQEAKALALPAVLAYVGTRVAGAVGVSGSIGQIVAGIIGAGAGIYLAKKF